MCFISPSLQVNSMRLGSCSCSMVITTGHGYLIVVFTSILGFSESLLGCKHWLLDTKEESTSRLRNSFQPPVSPALGTSRSAFKLSTSCKRNLQKHLTNIHLETKCHNSNGYQWPWALHLAQGDSHPLMSIPQASSLYTSSLQVPATSSFRKGLWYIQ